MSEHTTATSMPTDPPKPAASRRKTAARKPRPKKAGPGANGQRDAYGRFQVGNPGGYGNPYARQVAMLRRELMQRTRPEEIREIGNKLLSLAKAGNVQAAKVVLSYTLGLPTPAQPPDRVDADEMSLFSEEIELQEDLNEQLKNPGLEVHLRHIRSRRQYYAYLAAKMFVGAYTATPEEKKRHPRRRPACPRSSAPSAGPSSARPKTGSPSWSKSCSTSPGCPGRPRRRRARTPRPPMRRKPQRR